MSLGVNFSMPWGTARVFDHHEESGNSSIDHSHLLLKYGSYESRTKMHSSLLMSSVTTEISLPRK